MIKLFEKSETDKYIIIRILFVKISFKKKPPKSNIDAIVWWIPIKSLRDAIRNIYYNVFSGINDNNYLNTIYFKILEYLEMSKVVNKKVFLNYKNIKENFV